MDSDKILASAELIWNLWRSGGRVPCLPPELRPATRGEGYAIQAQLQTHSTGSLFGWKIAATSKASVTHTAAPITGIMFSNPVKNPSA